MAGLRARQKLEREQRILAAAARLFSRQGYAATSMEDVARRARLAVGTLYNYFPSKPELLLAIVRADTSETLLAFEAILKRQGLAPGELLSHLCDASIDFIARHDRSLWRELLAAALANPEAVAAALFTEDLRMIGQFAAALERLRDEGAVKAGIDPGRSALVLYSVYMLWFLTWVASDEVTLDDVRAEIRAGITIAMEGLLA